MGGRHLYMMSKRDALGTDMTWCNWWCYDCISISSALLLIVQFFHEQASYVVFVGSLCVWCSGSFLGHHKTCGSGDSSALVTAVLRWFSISFHSHTYPLRPLCQTHMSNQCMLFLGVELKWFYLLYVMSCCFILSAWCLSFCRMVWPPFGQLMCEVLLAVPFSCYYGYCTLCCLDLLCCS